MNVAVSSRIYDLLHTEFDFLPRPFNTVNQHLYLSHLVSGENKQNRKGEVFILMTSQVTFATQQTTHTETPRTGFAARPKPFIAKDLRLILLSSCFPVGKFLSFFEVLPCA